MKKVLFLIFSFVIIAVSLKSQSDGEVHIISHPNESMEIFATGLSGSGEYVTGYSGFSVNSFLWTKAGGINQFDLGIGGSSAFAVSDNMIVTGQFPDSLYMYTNIDQIYVPLMSAGYYYNGKWNSLGLKEGMIIEDLGGSLAEAISEDGTKIGGARKSVPISGHGMLEPVIWTINGEQSTPTVLEFPNSGQGARIQAMSGDGNVAGGWAAPYNSRSPVVWINGVLRYITDNGTIIEGEVNGISSNGKYAALTANTLAAIYDIEADRLTMIGKRDGAMASTATGVSDDGIVVGYNQLGLMMDREGFIYSEKFGRISISEYLEELNIDVPQPVSFLTPMAISADGSKFVGFGYQGNVMKGWYIEITNHISGLNPARYLSVREQDLGNISISWFAPNEDDSNTFTGYNIYRNGVKINESPLTTTSYNDQGLSNGTYRYRVTAVWNTSEESLPTTEISINTALVEMPFFDDFSSNNYNTNYWNILPFSQRWSITDFAGISPPSFSYVTSVGSTYSDTIITPYINKGENTEINLSFNIAIPVDYEGLSRNEHLKVEVYNGTTWNEVASFIPLTSGNNSFQHRNYDISQWTTGERIRVRFVAYGQEEGAFLAWTIDNVNVYGSNDAFIVEKPLHVSAYRTESGAINVNWADPGDVVKLSFIPDSTVYGWIGNEGAPFIAANLYSSEDLAEFDGYKLTSISAHLSHTIQGGQMAEYKLIAFQGNERVLYQDITTFNVNAWNTFQLNEPVIIDASRPLYFGVEVVSHDPADWPVGYCGGVVTGEWGSEINVNDRRSNLISTDNGATWTTLTAFDIVYSLAITGLIVSDDEATPKDRLIGYRIFRNGEDLLGDDGMGNFYITSLNNYTDHDFLTNEESCYEILAYYTVQQESERSAPPVCVSASVAVEEVTMANNVDIYPNPSTGIVNIEVEKDSKIRIIDVTGRIIETHNLNGNSSVIINQPAGVYFVQIETEGKTVTQKIIIN